MFILLIMSGDFNHRQGSEKHSQFGETRMSKRIYMILWIFAALIAVLLLAVTAGLTIKARAQADSSITVYVGGKSRLVHLRKEPDSISRIMGMLERGTAVAVINSAIKNRQTWYHIETESASGWIQAQYISLNRP